MEIIVARELNTLYIILDILFLLFLGYLLLKHSKFNAFTFGLFGAIAYFFVDYGLFYLLLGTREVHNADPFWFLLWLSASYGFTNFTWIWLWLSKDKRLLEWSLLIPISWLAIALLSQNFGANFSVINIARGTIGYHGIMALFLVVGYGIVIYKNLNANDSQRINILWLLAIGILVQFSWEFVLLISGIRPSMYMPIIVNSLLETNLGIPYIYFIHQFVTNRQDKVNASLI